MAAMASPSYQNGLYVPKMPWFEPSSEPTAKASLLSQTVNTDSRFTFPANRDFWNNFVTQVRVYPGAMDRPHYHVDASHTDESVLVNQEFLRRFVSGWERANPHVVIVNSPHGTSTFHASEDFWNRFVTLAGQRARQRDARGERGMEDTTVESSNLPNMPKVRTTEADWNDICQGWEQEQKLGIYAPAQPQPQPRAVSQFQPQQQLPPQITFNPPAQQQPLGVDPSLLHQQNMELDNQRAQIAQQNRQLEDMRSQLANANQHAMGSVTISDELRRAQSEASRFQQESEALRANQQRLQFEKDTLEERIRNLEQMLGGLQGDVQRQREEAQREALRQRQELQHDASAREKELAELRQAADVADLRKELQMRELMQEELFRVREEAQREAEDKVRAETTTKIQHEVGAMRRHLAESGGDPRPHPGCRRCASHSGRRRQFQHGQRTVATQTPPRDIVAAGTGRLAHHTDGAGNNVVSIGMGAVMPASVLQHAPPGTAVVHAADDRSADFYYHSSPQVPASKALDYEYFRPISAPLMGARAAQPSGRAW